MREQPHFGVYTKESALKVHKKKLEKNWSNFCGLLYLTEVKLNNIIL